MSRRVSISCLVFLFILGAGLLDYFPALAHDRGSFNREILLTQFSGGVPQRELPLITLQSGSVELEVEVAVNYQQKSTGLMFRLDLADGRGMIFVYNSDQYLGFWMKNTYIPLSIAYLNAEGVILEIYDMHPLSSQTVYSSRPVRFALEVPLGWFKRAGLEPGDKFEFPPGFPNY